MLNFVIPEGDGNGAFASHQHYQPFGPGYRCVELYIVSNCVRKFRKDVLIWKLYNIARLWDKKRIEMNLAESNNEKLVVS